ncbi:hypothetical protein [Dactylosporangium sp. NPDC005555]|uniref:Rv0361 family membrane protein n=1 Tax=Dactylosporangium sp. NPDC005555 TaxID=3154889 RepID=UPI0033B6DDC5
MEQSRSRRSSAKIVLTVIAVLAVLCCCGGGAGAFFFFNGATKAAGEATSAFLTDLQAGNLTAAYDRLCDATRSRYEQPSFAEVVNRRKPVSHDVHWGGGYDNSNGRETASITADISYAGGGRDAHTFQLTKDAGTWEICGDPY